MKNYESDKVKKKTFILNYKVDNNEIEIHFASGAKERIPYSIENELKILNYMKGQVLDSEDFYKNLKEKNEFEKFIIGGVTICLVVNLATAYGCKDEFSSFFKWTTAIFALIETIRIIIYQKRKEIIEDIRKNKLFLFNEREINNFLEEKDVNNTLKEYFGIEKNRINNYNNTKFPTNEIPHLTLNDIDKVKKEELETLINRIEYEKKLNNNYLKRNYYLK